MLSGQPSPGIIGTPQSHEVIHDTPANESVLITSEIITDDMQLIDELQYTQDIIPTVIANENRENTQNQNRSLAFVLLSIFALILLTSDLVLRRISGKGSTWKK